MHQRSLRGPALARVHASTSANNLVRPSTHRGAGPHAFACTHCTRAPAHVRPSTHRSAGPVCVAAPIALVPVPVRAPPSAVWDAAVDHYLSAAQVGVLPCPARRSRDDMMFDFQVNNILCCLEDFNNGVLEDDNDGAARHLRRRRK